MSSHKEQRAQPVEEEVSILVADGYVQEYHAVVRRCKRAGLHQVSELPTIGVINGTIVAAKIAELTLVEGVASVERQATLGIAPPESDVQAIDPHDATERGSRKHGDKQ